MSKETKGILDSILQSLGISDLPETPPRDTHIETLRSLLRYAQDSVPKLEQEIEDLQQKIELAKRALNEITGSTIPAYEAEIERMMQEQELGLRSDQRPLSAKPAAAHNLYR